MVDEKAPRGKILTASRGFGRSRRKNEGIFGKSHESYVDFEVAQENGCARENMTRTQDLE